MKRTTYILITFISISAIVLGVGFRDLKHIFINTNTINELQNIDTADWLIYSDNAMNIKFQYPKNYEVKKISQNTLEIHTIKKQSMGVPFMIIDFFENEIDDYEPYINHYLKEHEYMDGWQINQFLTEQHKYEYYEIANVMRGHAINTLRFMFNPKGIVITTFMDHQNKKIYKEIVDSFYILE